MYRLIVIPLSFLRRLDSLKYTSVIALISIGYLIILVVAHFAEGDTMQDRSPLRVFQWESKSAVLRTLPVVVFAYTCHQNVNIPGGSYRCIRKPDIACIDVLNSQRDQQQLAFHDHKRCRHQRRGIIYDLRSRSSHRLHHVWERYCRQHNSDVYAYLTALYTGPVIYAYKCQQIHHHSVLPLERPPLLFLLCSPTRSKSILVEHPSMPCSNGGQQRIQIRPDHRDQGTACSCSLENLVARPEGTEWATPNLPLSLPPYSS